ncbi:MAG: hypothetical protein IJ300_11600 [Clostridia bacterium]|nr:hypothetical protein [Clostridia bacterium]
MFNLKCFLKRNPLVLTAKISGVFIFSFCVGTLAGLFLPVAFIAAIETALLLMLAWFCLFKF